MFIFLKSFFLFFVFSEVIFLSLFFFDQEIDFHGFFLYVFFFIIFFKYFLESEKEKYDNEVNDGDKNIDSNFNIDLIFKFFILLFKIPSLFFNYVLNFFKKILFFLYYYKYRELLNTSKIFWKKFFSSSFIMWRPLFKKSSYFGYYRSNRSKWIK